jgi:DNA-directed RNA polymerase, mitochondrial
LGLGRISGRIYHFYQGEVAMEMSKIEQQLKIEKEMIGMGIKRCRDGIQKAVDNQQEANTGYGTRIMAQSIPPLSEAIKAFVERANGRRGVTHRSVRYIEMCDTNVLAFLTIRSVINSISRPSTFTASVIKLANAIEEQVKFERFEDENPALWGTLIRDLKRTSSSLHKKKVLTHSMNKAGIEWMGWSKVDKVHLGTKLTELFIETTGMARMVTIHTKAKKSVIQIQATEETLDWIERDTSLRELLTPFNLSFVITLTWTTKTSFK